MRRPLGRKLWRPSYVLVHATPDAVTDAWTGTLRAIYTAPEAKAPMRARDAVRAVPGRGLEGDRYFKGEGAFSRWPFGRW